MTGLRILTTTWQADASRLALIRRRVFIEEQGVPEALEWDDRDDSASHFLACVNRQAIGTARLLKNGHIGRMAVLPEWRNQGIGSALLARAIETAKARGDDEVFLDAQTHAISFYERFGFRAEGDGFMDAGMPHQRMRRNV